MPEALTRTQKVQISTQLFRAADRGVAGITDSESVRADVAVGYAHGLGWTFTQHDVAEDGTPVMLIELDRTPIADVH